MEQEEVRIKLGVDNSQVAPGLNDFKQRVDQAATGAHKSFIHASNGAREFKKAMHEVSNESPLLGLALKAAISPIGAMFTGATLAAAGFKSMLDDVNARLSSMASRNAATFGDGVGGAKAIAARIAEVNSGHASFVSSQISKSAGTPGSAVDAGLAAIQTFFSGGNAAYPVQVDAERSLLKKGRGMVAGKAVSVEKEISGLEGNAKSKVSGALVDAKKQAEDLRGEIAAIKSKEVQLREDESSDENAKVGFGVDFRQVKKGFMKALGLPTENPSDELNRLDNYQRKLKHIEETIASLTKIEEKNNEQLKAKKEQLSGLLDDMRKFDKQIGGLPRTELVPGMMNIPMGGLLPNLPVFMPTARMAPGQFNQSAIINSVLQQVQNALNSADGIPVSINVKEQ